METTKLDGSWTDPTLGRVLFGDWLTEWQRTTTNRRPTTEVRDDSIIRTHVRPRFGGVPLAAIGQRDVRAWVAELAARRLAPTTVRKVYQVFSKVMAAAVDAGMIARSPCRNVPLPKVDHKEMRFLTRPKSPGLPGRSTRATAPWSSWPPTAVCAWASWPGSGAGISISPGTRSR